MSTRTKDLEHTIGFIEKDEYEKLRKFIKSSPPHDLEVENYEQQEPLLLTTLNKSCPYISIHKDLELDKNQNPIYSFRFVSNGITPETKEIYLGSFGAEEVIEALNDISKNPRSENELETLTI